MGYQRWIATMKPMRFLGKRSNPDGGSEAPRSKKVEDYYHLGKRNFNWLRQKKYSSSDRITLLVKLTEQKPPKKYWIND